VLLAEKFGSEGSKESLVLVLPAEKVGPNVY
jgi:hypothetical protein